MTTGRAEFVAIRRERIALGQAAPGAGVDTTLYTVPKGFTARGRVLFAERGAATATVRIALRPAGAALANVHYLAYNAPLGIHEDAHTVELQLEQDDVLTVRASTADVSFTFTGVLEPRAQSA